MRRSQTLLQNAARSYKCLPAQISQTNAPRVSRWQPCPYRPIAPRHFYPQSQVAKRFNSSSSTTPSQVQPEQQQAERKAWRPAPHRNPDEPVYEMYFTCKVCKHRSAHTISKQGYHAGTTLVKCPGCQNRHLISDHLKIFSDKAITVEDLLAQKGESIEKATIDTDGDMEFWEDKATKGN